MNNNIDKKNQIVESLELKFEKFKDKILEKKYIEANRFFKYTLTAITILVVIIGFFSFSARQEVSQSLSDI